MPVTDPAHFGGIDFHTLRGHEVPKERNPSSQQLTLLRFKFQAGQSKSIQDLSQPREVGIHGIRKDDYIINVQDCYLPLQAREHVFHKTLERCWCVA